MRGMAGFGVSHRLSLLLQPLLSFPVLCLLQMEDESSWDLPSPDQFPAHLLALEGSPAGMLDVQSYSLHLFSFPLLAKEALLEVLSPPLGLPKLPKPCK